MTFALFKSLGKASKTPIVSITLFEFSATFESERRTSRRDFDACSQSWQECSKHSATSRLCRHQPPWPNQRDLPRDPKPESSNIRASPNGHTPGNSVVSEINCELSPYIRVIFEAVFYTLAAAYAFETCNAETCSRSPMVSPRSGRLVHKDTPLQRQRIKGLGSQSGEKSQIRRPIRNLCFNSITASLAPGKLRDAVATSETLHLTSQTNQ